MLSVDCLFGMRTNIQALAANMGDRRREREPRAPERMLRSEMGTRSPVFLCDGNFRIRENGFAICSNMFSALLSIRFSVSPLNLRILLSISNASAMISSLLPSSSSSSACFYFIRPLLFVAVVLVVVGGDLAKRFDLCIPSQWFICRPPIAPIALTMTTPKTMKSDYDVESLCESALDSESATIGFLFSVRCTKSDLLLLLLSAAVPLLGER